MVLLPLRLLTFRLLSHSRHCRHFFIFYFLNDHDDQSNINILYFCLHIKITVMHLFVSIRDGSHKNINILSFTHPHVILNMYY